MVELDGDTMKVKLGRFRIGWKYDAREGMHIRKPFVSLPRLNCGCWRFWVGRFFVGRHCAFLMLLLMPAISYAIEWNQAQLTWVQVTTYDDFKPIIEPVTYRVYAGKKGEIKGAVATVSTTSILRTNIPAGEWCWQVAAIANGIEGARSAEVCKVIGTVPASKIPATVTDLRVE